MKQAVVVLCLSVAVIPTRAQPAVTASTTVRTTPVVAPEFDAERALQWSSSRTDYEQARLDSRFALEQFTYQSDGLTVGAYLYRAIAPTATPKPVIVFNRGSAARPTGFTGEMLVMAHRYADAGFVVVCTTLPGKQRLVGTR